MGELGLFVMQHVRAAAAVVSVLTAFVAALFVPDDGAEIATPIPAKPVPVPVIPASCQQALVQGARLVSASVTGESQLLDALGANPSQLPDLLDSYGRTLSKLNQRLPAYTVAWRRCERQTA